MIENDHSHDYSSNIPHNNLSIRHITMLLIISQMRNIVNSSISFDLLRKW